MDGQRQQGRRPRRDVAPPTAAETAGTDAASDLTDAGAMVNPGAASSLVSAAARQERVVTLYCQGVRTPAIAASLGASESSVRRWLRAGLAVLAREARAERAALLVRAIESQRAIASAAWEAYERECALEDALLRRASADEYERPRHAGQGARYLAVALTAQREVARLQGLYERISQEPAPVRITLSRRPDGPENVVDSYPASGAADGGARPAREDGQ